MLCAFPSLSSNEKVRKRPFAAPGGIFFLRLKWIAWLIIAPRRNRSTDVQSSLCLTMRTLRASENPMPPLCPLLAA